MNRRDFLHTAGCMSALAATSPMMLSAAESGSRPPVTGISGKSVLEMQKSIPIIEETDVAVVGGGIAGVAAALAAARLGARTVLIEKETALGGLATLGNVIVYLPICDGMGRQVIGGIGEELLRLSVRDGFRKIPACWEKDGNPEQRKKSRFRVDFNPASLMLDMEELLLKHNVRIWYDTRFCDVVREDGRVSALLLENKSGRVAMNCRTVVDASGDADVCARAGEPTESLPTNVECGWFYHLEKGAEIKADPEEDVGNEERPKSSKGGGTRLAVNAMSKPFSADPRKLSPDTRGYAGDDGRDTTEFVLATHEMIRKKISDLRAKAKGKSEIYPAILPLVPSFRMTRRLVGDLEIQYKDDHRYSDDAVGMTGDWRKNGPVYFIPYR
ncbi:MAG: FAD-dependent oxidoreductase, partial [Victivallales bacterium]